MKLYLQQDDETLVKIREIESIGENTDVLIFFIERMLSKADIEKYEQFLSDKTGKECIVLESFFSEKILGIKR